MIWAKIAAMFRLAGKVEFKTPRTASEWQDKRLNSKAREIALYAARIMLKTWLYRPVITSIYRSTSEQQALIKAGKPGSAQSPHCFWRGIDIRWKDYPIHDGDALVKMLNKKYPRKDKRQTAILHGKGDNLHLHIQVQA